MRLRIRPAAPRDHVLVGHLLREISASSAVISALSPVGDGLLQLTKIAD